MVKIEPILSSRGFFQISKFQRLEYFNIDQIIFSPKFVTFGPIWPRPIIFGEIQSIWVKTNPIKQFAPFTYKEFE